MKAKLEVTIVVEYPIFGDAPPEDPWFFYEEHLCADDVIDYIEQEAEAASKKGTCTCNRAKIKFLEYTE